MTSTSTAKKEQWNFQAPLILAHLLIQTHRLQEDLGKVMNNCKANASVMQTECEFSCFTVPPIWTCLWKILAHGHHCFPPDFCHHACLLTLLLSCWMYGGLIELKGPPRLKSNTCEEFWVNLFCTEPSEKGTFSTLGRWEIKVSISDQKMVASKAISLLSWSIAKRHCNSLSLRNFLHS